ncbi:MAG TPA: SIS domain-containing protein [Streptosporangiaceae bacterium]|jgi:glucose/mannose-6-phosphate isomerase
MTVDADAEERLDATALLPAADPADMLRQVASSAAQVRSAVRATQEADLAEITDAGRPRAIVVTGMGGSGVAGDVLAAVCGPGCPAQILPVHDYQLPAWVGATDLVIAISCSGGTEETISAAAEAVRRGCRLIGVGGEGSPLAMIAQQARAPFIGVPSAGMPRSTLWGLSMPLVVIASRLGLLEAAAADYESAAAELERISHLCRPDSESFVNPAKSLALQLAGTLPMIWASSPLAGVAAYRFGTQLSENAKYPAVVGILPEANHNQVVTFDGPFAAGPGRIGGALGLDEPGEEGPPVPLRLVLLRDSREHPQVARRREESAQLAAERGIGVSELAAADGGPLERLASLVQLIDYATVYLAIALGIDPGPIAAIQELKARIA